MPTQANEDIFFYGEDIMSESMPSIDGWEEDFGGNVSEKASQNGQKAYRVFDQVYKQWNDDAALVPGKTYLFDMLTPDLHLVRKVYKSLKQYVKSHDGWTLQRREATESERYMYNVKRKSKAYFIVAEYRVPLLEERVPLVSDIFEDAALPVIDHPSFSKSSNSAFSPARIRLYDSTNDGSHKTRKGPKATFTRVKDAASTTTDVDPSRSFVPVMPASARSTKTSPLGHRVLPLTTKSPRSPHIPPESSVFSSFPDEVLLAAPQTQLPGGFVYGDVVLLQGPSRRAMVVGSTVKANDYDEDRLVVSLNMERLEVSVEDLKLVKSMPRWNTTEGLVSPPITSGRSHLPSNR